LKRVIACQPGHVIDDLVVVLDPKLRCIWIGPNVQTEVVEGNVWKYCKSRKTELWNREVLRRATKRKTRLINQIGREIVNQRVGKQSLLARDGDEEDRQIRSIV